MCMKVGFGPTSFLKKIVFSDFKQHHPTVGNLLKLFNFLNKCIASLLWMWNKIKRCYNGLPATKLFFFYFKKKGEAHRLNGDGPCSTRLKI
jgi:hypothetical protein